jgi:hypothetical protein
MQPKQLPVFCKKKDKVLKKTADMPWTIFPKTGEIIAWHDKRQNY